MHQVSVFKHRELLERTQKKSKCVFLLNGFEANDMFLQVQKNGDGLKEIYSSS